MNKDSQPYSVDEIFLLKHLAALEAACVKFKLTNILG